MTWSKKHFDHSAAAGLCTSYAHDWLSESMLHHLPHTSCLAFKLQTSISVFHLDLVLYIDLLLWLIWAQGDSQQAQVDPQIDKPKVYFSSCSHWISSLSNFTSQNPKRVQQAQGHIPSHLYRLRSQNNAFCNHFMHHSSDFSWRGQSWGHHEHD